MSLPVEKFVAKFSGPFVTGPGRFIDQASQTFIKGGGTSSAFLHGNLQMAVYTPVDPNGQTTRHRGTHRQERLEHGEPARPRPPGRHQSLDRGGPPDPLHLDRGRLERWYIQRRHRPGNRRDPLSTRRQAPRPCSECRDRWCHLPGPHRHQWRDEHPSDVKPRRAVFSAVSEWVAYTTEVHTIILNPKRQRGSVGKPPC